MPPPVLDALILQTLSHGGALLLVTQHWECTYLGMQCQAAGGLGDSTWILSTHRPELQGQGRLSGEGPCLFLTGVLLPSSLGVFHEDIDLILRVLL